ncbi:unnamed protein product [Brassicogethes aeneus]|uniref:phosphatidate cytidylyltransferase n=1 Tax=Brassicogethes aeneus TaxID=1431903 RepID=A0A9P0B7U9_BRAAE|nr:unnamed protein product [Brassicogethes aeneus]
MKHITRADFIPKVESNLTKRFILGITMVTGFSLIIYGGPLTIMLMITLVQFKCFEEIMNLAYEAKKLPKESKLRRINIYFVLVGNYFFYGEVSKIHFKVFADTFATVRFLVSYHSFISFCAYLFGFIWFVTNVKKNELRKQFSLFFWTHFLILIIVVQASLLVNIVFEGLIWNVVPISLVVLNDIFAFIFGKLLGKTPLIKLSPKKTMEGYIFGAFGTVLMGLLLSQFLCQFDFFTCPIEYMNTSSGISMNTNCNSTYIFSPIDFYGIHSYPFVFHSLVISVFASIIAPFGGFCASGFKRSMKVKDFGDIIPGHGGMMDRNDCQFLMATFVHVYINTFIKNTNYNDINKIFQKLLYMNEESQLEFYYLLENHIRHNVNSSISF